MKNVIFAMVALVFVASCDAGNNKQPSASTAEIQRKTDDTRQF